MLLRLQEALRGHTPCVLPWGEEEIKTRTDSWSSQFHFVSPVPTFSRTEARPFILPAPCVSSFFFFRASSLLLSVSPLSPSPYSYPVCEGLEATAALSSPSRCPEWPKVRSQGCPGQPQPAAAAVPLGGVSLQGGLGVPRSSSMPRPLSGPALEPRVLSGGEATPPRRVHEGSGGKRKEHWSRSLDLNCTHTWPPSRSPGTAVTPPPVVVE